jgi:DNA polymerase elongation subunit (family B)
VDTAKTSKFEGALVLEPETGVYMEDPIVVLDFSSLYPSSIIATNMSHDTLLPLVKKDDVWSRLWDWRPTT